MSDKEGIREFIRKNYSEVALQGSVGDVAVVAVAVEAHR